MLFLWVKIYLTIKQIIQNAKAGQYGDCTAREIVAALKYIIQNKTAFISQSEYSQLITKEAFIVSKLNSYIKKYIKALEHQDIKKNYLLCSMSCLKYFHDELNIKTSY